MSLAYLRGLGSYTYTTLLREATVYAGPSTDADVVVVYPANTTVGVEPVVDRADWMRLANIGPDASVYGFVQASAVNMPALPRASAPAVGPATKVFAGVLGFALLYLVVTK